MKKTNNEKIRNKINKKTEIDKKVEYIKKKYLK